MGGMAGNILFIMIIMNVGLLFFGFHSGLTMALGFISVDAGAGDVAVPENLSDQLAQILAINTGFSILAGIGLYISGLGQYSIFAGFMAWMLGFAFLPLSLFTVAGMPFMVKAILGVPLVAGFIVSLIGWFRGADM